jgi:HD superfamily phosphodiesterase
MCYNKVHMEQIPPRDLWHILAMFVRRITHDRDPSHGFDHMAAVCDNAIRIMAGMELTDKQIYNTTIVAWLHDVADHKYDKNGRLAAAVKRFLHTIVPAADIDYIMKCIKFVSFSVEARLGRDHFIKVLPAEWLVVRDIASDADKLEAMGLAGIERCKSYARHQMQDSPFTPQQLFVKHYIKVLSRLPKYMHTPIGKRLGGPLHEEMRTAVISFKAS